MPARGVLTRAGCREPAEDLGSRLPGITASTMPSTPARSPRPFSGREMRRLGSARPLPKPQASSG